MIQVFHRQKNLFYLIMVLGLLFGNVGLVYANGPTTPCTPSSLNPLKVCSIDQLIKAIANIVMQIGSIVAVIFIIWSGFMFVTARGNEEQLKKAKSMFMWTIIGTAVLLGAYVIATAVTEFVKGLG